MTTKHSTRLVSTAIGIILASIVGCADDSAPSRPEDQKSSGGSAGKTTSSAGRASQGGAPSTSGGATGTSGGSPAAAGQGSTTTAAAGGGALLGIAGGQSTGAGAPSAGGATSIGGTTSTGGTSTVAKGGASAIGGAYASGGVNVMASGGVAAVGSAGTTAIGGTNTTGGAKATSGAPGTGGTGQAGATTSVAGGVAGFAGAAGSATVVPNCTIYVDAATGNDSDDGGSWVNAKATLQAGIDKARQQGNCDVWVAAGRYKPTASAVRSISIILRPNIRVFGGFLYGDTTLGARNFQTNETILDGDIGTAGTATDNSYSVVTGGEGATLDGFTITNGCAAVALNGGGIYNASANFTVRNCIIKNHAQPGVDGTASAIYSTGSGFLLQNSTISSNTAYGHFQASSTAAYHLYGVVMLLGLGSTVDGCVFDKNVQGALKISAENASVHNTTFSNNSSNIGGAIYAPWGTATAVDNCRFTGNSAVGGGAIFSEGTLSIANSTFDGNSATEYSGAVYAPGTLSITNSAFEHNSAGVYAGAILGIAATLDRCVVARNTASKYAGGVWIGGGSAVARNSVFYGNSAGDNGGGAFYLVAGAKLKVVNSTIVGNTSLVGAGIFSVASGNELTLLNSILWGNQTDQVVGGTTIATYTINEGDYFTGAGNSGNNPQFVDIATGDLRLKTGSPAINAGTAEGAPAVDLLGVARDATPDLGAYEGGVSP